MLVLEAQPSCPGWPPSAALCPGCFLCRNWMHSPCLEALMCLWAVEGFLNTFKEWEPVCRGKYWWIRQQALCAAGQMDGDRIQSSLLREAGNKGPDQLPAESMLRHGCEQGSPPLRCLCLLVLITHHCLWFFLESLHSVFRDTVALSHS